MTDHIVSFSIGIDDDAIINNIQDKACKEIIKDIKVDALNKIFRARYYGDKAVSTTREGNIKVDSNAELSNFVVDLIREALLDCRNEVISRAAEILADSYKRTKAWKEKAGEVLE